MNSEWWSYTQRAHTLSVHQHCSEHTTTLQYTAMHCAYIVAVTTIIIINIDLYQHQRRLLLTVFTQSAQPSTNTLDIDGFNIACQPGLEDILQTSILYVTNINISIRDGIVKRNFKFWARSTIRGIGPTARKPVKSQRSRRRIVSE